MASFLWYPLLIVFGVFGGALLCYPLTQRMPARWLIATAGYLTLDAEVLVGGTHLLTWNWIGKAASVLLACIAMRAFRLSATEVGVNLPEPGSWGWISAALTVAVIWSVAGVQGMYRQHFTFQALSYQASMPGIAEELVYRGVAYAMLLRGFGDGRPRSAPVAAVVITSFCFGLGHLEPPIGLPPPGWLFLMIRFASFQVGARFLLGALLAFMRWRSGSLLGPILAHGAYNVAGTLALARTRP